jgi:hypothetical protein
MPATDQATQTPAEVRVQGEITWQATSRAISKLGRDCGSLVITSQGGDPEAALSLADLVRAHNNATNQELAANASYRCVI